MFFLQATQAPVIAKVGAETLSIPKFTRADFKEWGAKFVAESSASATVGMDEIRKREYLTFYTNFGVDFNDLRKMARTQEGSEHICRTCLKRAKVTVDGADRPMKTPEEVEAMIAANGIGPIIALAWALADLDETALLRPPPEEKTEGDADPLAPSA